MRKRALISVYKKDGIIELGECLFKNGYEIVSSGGTYKYLKENNIQVTKIEDITEFPEILGGRVKTLHPVIHGGILSREIDSDKKELEENNIIPIDIVAVNLYPFEEVKNDASIEELIEMIDIGGVALIRAAAKNFKRVAVAVELADYKKIINELNNTGKINDPLREELSIKAFKTTMRYDSIIWERLSGLLQKKNNTAVILENGKELRYGENPHQKAKLYRTDSEYSLYEAEILHGKQMSYNNYIDLYSAVRPLFYIQDTAAVVIKHTNPCGLSVNKDLCKAFEYAWEGDPKSAFGSIVSFNRKCSLAAAEMTKGKFIEVIAAPDYDEDAIEYLKNKSANLRIVKLDIDKLKESKRELHLFNGIVLDTVMDDISEKDFKNVTEKDFNIEDKLGLIKFGIVSSGVIKSNSVALVCRTPDSGGYMQIGMGSGQPNRIDSLSRLAIPKALDNAEKLFGKRELPEDTVLVSEAFFPFSDTIETAHEYGIKYIIQPGGSKRDEEVIEKCNELGIAMIFTGVRHFRH